MDFPIIDLIDEEMAADWLLTHFHPDGLQCPHCGAGVQEARHFGRTRKSDLQIYRCLLCEGVYNLYSGTVFERTHFNPGQVVLLLRGICQGVPTAQLARELGVSRPTVMSIRRVIQSNAALMCSAAALPDGVVETDEMFQNAGEKGDAHRDASDPPRRRGNKRKGRGTYANDRPPVVGTIGRESGTVRLRVTHRTDQATLTAHVHQFSHPGALVYTDGWGGYNDLQRTHAIVCHSDGEWARDADGDGFCEVHTNTIEGVWTTVRNFLRPFRGVHKKFLAGYIACCEFAINIKTITTEFISHLVQTKPCICS